MALSVLQKPPLRLSMVVTTPSGGTYRWAPDERRPQNVMGGLTFATVIPGGDDTASVTLTRDPKLDYPDLEELSDVKIYAVGNDVVAQYRIEGSPAQTGDDMTISPTLTGWQSHLDDNQGAQMIYIDQSQSTWTTSSVQRKLALTADGYLVSDSSQTPDQSTGEPAIDMALEGPWSAKAVCEAWYDAMGCPIGRIVFGWKIDPSTIDPDDPNWSWSVGMSPDDVGLTAPSFSGNLRSSGPSIGGLLASESGLLFAFLQLIYDIPAGMDGVSYGVFFTAVGVYGNHGLTPQGPATATLAPGLLSSDIENHAVSTFCPRIQIARNSIQPSSYIIPQAVFTSPGGASAIIKQVTGYEIRDWQVSPGPGGMPTYFSNAYGAKGNHWIARAREANLQNAGPQINRLYNGVLVQFTDVNGTSRVVGPPGSYTNFQDESLVDPDPLNPCNEAGINRYASLSMGTTSNVSTAVQAGQQFLQQQKLLVTAGSAQIVGYIMNSQGVFYQAFKIRGGDTISFVDASETGPRRVISTSYDDTTKTNTIQLDQPPDNMTAILQRLNVALAPIIGA